jgi:hypothetical protein
MYHSRSYWLMSFPRRSSHQVPLAKGVQSGVAAPVVNAQEDEDAKLQARLAQLKSK